MYIFCLTRTLINRRQIYMPSCPGSDPLKNSHCEFCEYYSKNKEVDRQEDTSYEANN